VILVGLFALCGHVCRSEIAAVRLSVSLSLRRSSRNVVSRAGDSKYVSGSYGFGDLETKGYNVLAAFRHDQQTQIKSTGREFAKTAYIPFDFRGNHYIYVHWLSVPGSV
jgi:hypothetical protein